MGNCREHGQFCIFIFVRIKFKPWKYFGFCYLQCSDVEGTEMLNMSTSENSVLDSVLEGKFSFL